MNFFDLFRKKKKQTNGKTDLTIKPLNDEQTVDITSAVSNNITDSSIFNIQIDGERLKYVEYDGFNNLEQDIVFVVPKEVKAIDGFAFSRIKNLKKVIMHKDIRYIDQMAFSGCKKLQSVIGLEDSETMKIFNGFCGCSSLEEISIPQNVEIIGNNALKGCKKISKINLPSSCWSISPYAFSECESLKYIEIPANTELVSTGAFEGCKDLVIVFLDDNDKKYLEDYYKEDFGTSNMYDFYPENEKLVEQEEIKSDNEATEILYNDLNVKYKKINVDGKEFLWTIGRIIIQENALSDVKEVICFNDDIAKKIIKSGYKGKITIVNREKQTKYSIDFRLLESLKKEQKAKQREIYYKQFLIPSGGTTNWMLNCEQRNYRCNGYHKNIVSEIKISDDSRIEIKDYTQTSNSGEEEFFTAITFYKKELDNYSEYAPYIYDRSYSIYYPYGARFNEELLKKIGYALSYLINNARDLNDTVENQEILSNINNQQKQLIELFINGTNDEMSVEKIMGNIQNIFVDGRIREAKIQKDWLPCYTQDEERKVLKNKNNLKR